MAKQRHSRSSIKKLPQPVQDVIDRALGDDWTLDQIVDALKALQTDVPFTPPSRSAVGRYADSIRATQEEMFRVRTISNALMPALTDEPENKAGRLVGQLLEGAIFNILTAVKFDEATGEMKSTPIDPKLIVQLAAARRDLATASKTEADRILKIKQEAAKEALKAVEGVAKKRGFDAETMAEIRATVLGMRV